MTKLDMNTTEVSPIFDVVGVTGTSGKIKVTHVAFNETHRGAVMGRVYFITVDGRPPGHLHPINDKNFINELNDFLAETFTEFVAKLPSELVYASTGMQDPSSVAIRTTKDKL